MIIVDTGVLVAAADADDQHHQSCAELLDRDERFVVPVGVVVEVCWMLGRHVSAESEAAFLRSIAAGEIEVESLASDDYERIVHLVETYGDLPLGTVDAMVVTVAERLGSDTIATIDRRDFSVVRPRHVPAFKLLP